MDNDRIGHHISRQFNEELEDLRNRVLTMGGLVEQQLADAITALVTGDSKLAELVISSDYKVNALEVSIDEECTQILALRHPAATDLRLIIAVIKTITDLERIGVEAERIGHTALHLASAEGTKKPYDEIENLGNHVRRMVHDCLDAFARLDTNAALQVWKEDIKVDKEYESVMRQLIAFMMEDPRSIPRVLDIIWTARAMERIGDRARNVCEYIIYLVQGKDVRHTSKEHLEREVRGHQP